MTTRSRQSKVRKPPPAKGINWTLIGLGGAIVLVLAIVVYAVGQASAPLPGQAAPIQGREHVQPGEPHPPYNTSPPTSGWHFQNPAKWGVHTEPIQEEIQIHNLEHGGIVIQYNCPQGCRDVVDQLQKIVGQYQTKVILAPYPKMQTKIAVTAWGRIDTMDQVDEARIKRFISAFINRGPEDAP